MDVEIVSKEFIKPSQPTLPHCKIYKLSLFDQQMSTNYVPILFFYKSPKLYSEKYNDLNQITRHLKNSLSQILTIHYPFAGTIEEPDYICCNDVGAVFFVGQIKHKIADVHKLPEPYFLLNKLLPAESNWNCSDNKVVLAIQLTFFACGGISIGVYISHKIGDASSMCTFLNDWASLGHKYEDKLFHYQSSHLSSTINLHDENILQKKESQLIERANLVTRRFVFSSTKIIALKTKICAQNSVVNLSSITRVESISSLLYKCIVQVSRSSLLSLKKPSKKLYVFKQVVNLRNRMDPPLPSNSIGNFISYFNVIVNDMEALDEDDTMLGNVIIKMREGFKEVCEFAKNAKQDDWILRFRKSLEYGKNDRTMMEETFMCSNSSWCRFNLYDVDFGWGKPAWVTVAGTIPKSCIILLDGGEDDGEGIEAIVTLDAPLMTSLETNEQLLRFAMLNPKVI